jgi:hypothetical protein
VSVGHGFRASLEAPEKALQLFGRGNSVQVRLVWFDRDAATPAEDTGTAT